METPQFRVGGKVALNVYEGDRPLFQAHTPEEAARLVELLNDAAELQREREENARLQGLLNGSVIVCRKWQEKTEAAEALAKDLFDALAKSNKYIWGAAKESFDTNQGWPEADFRDSDPEGFACYKDSCAVLERYHAAGMLARP